jgi:hypothetical protein
VKVVFFVRELPYVQRIYAPLLDELIDRGHEVHLAFTKKTRWDRIERGLAGIERDGLTFGYAPHRRESDGWRRVAWLVRSVADLARYAHPRYDRAPRLRARVTEKVLVRLEKATNLEPIGRALALRVARRLAAGTDAALSARVIRTAARLEQAIPSAPEIDRFLRTHAPGAVLVTPVVKYGSDEVEYLKSARALRIPAATCVASWDNLTNKGLLKFDPERVFVWNEAQRREAIELHGISPDHAVATGGQLFDKWFEQRPSRPRDEFAAEVGLDPAQPYVLYLCSSPFVVNRSRAEVDFVLGLLEALRASGDERLRRVGLMVRPYPRGSDWKKVDLAPYGNAVRWPPKHAHAVTPEALADFYDSIAHSAAVIGINTTAMIEAAIVGKPVLTILEPRFAQEGTLHFHHLLEENGGFLYAASSPEEHLAQLRRVLDEGEEDAERRRRFVEAFVRPHGLDRAATPIFADAVEELTRLEVAAPRYSPLLRGLLGVEAAACSALLALQPLLRPLRLRVVGAARSRRLLAPPRADVP